MSKITRHVAHIIYKPSIEQYLCEKQDWSNITWNDLKITRSGEIRHGIDHLSLDPFNLG
jgi:hypothetical protein